MNWLEPAEVEAWLELPPHAAENISAPPMPFAYALEQFVRALAERNWHDETCPKYNGIGKSCSCAAMVARLLVAAMEGK